MVREIGQNFALPVYQDLHYSCKKRTRLPVLDPSTTDFDQKTVFLGSLPQGRNRDRGSD